MKDLQPPLPEPWGYVQQEYSPHMEPMRGYFTETQLLAYRAEVIEMCAKEVDKVLGDNNISTELRSLK